MYRSRELLPKVTVSSDILDLITGICAEYQVDGMRADIVMYKTASTIAAYEGRTNVSAEDVREPPNWLFCTGSAANRSSSRT